MFDVHQHLNEPWRLALDVARGAARHVLDFILPPRCLACQQVVADPGSLCPVCWQEMNFICIPVCERLGVPLSHDMGAGGLSARAIAEPPVFDRARAVATYTGVARQLVLSLKFAHRRDLSDPLGRWMAIAGNELADPETIVVPVPLHRLRLLGRRFNQSADLAKAVGHHWRVCSHPLLLQRVRRTRQQVGLDAKARRKNVRGAFQVRKGYEHLVHGKPVVLVDDVLTTGSTVSACARALLQAGASRVDVLCFAIAADSHVDV
ncbi:ComF family protein [Roseibium sp.]|uniref:ComF family protein n=1 Tax=Roseibium sp. TaxID=1936156 RepID=UPI003A986D5B